MLTPSEERRVLDHAYVPEHVPGYVCSISQAEPHLLGDFLCYSAGSTLIFIGYPLQSAFELDTMQETVTSAVSCFKPEQVALVAPAIPAGCAMGTVETRDRYYRLDLSCCSYPPKVENMIRRASRDLSVETSREMQEEHLRLIEAFLGVRQLSQETRFIFERIADYVATVGTARVFSARDRQGSLVAFDVAELGGRQYAFYQFNFRSATHYVPGASDLLLREVIRMAGEQGKAFLNLGLGISRGVAHFKEKWGADPFLPYAYCRYRPGRRGLLDQLWRVR